MTAPGIPTSSSAVSALSVLHSAGATNPHPADPPNGSANPVAGPMPGVERVHRPWGWYETLLPPEPEGCGYAVKRLWLQPQGRISLQRHRQRSEHWVVVAGSGLLECAEDRIEAHPGVTLEVPLGAIHRASSGPEGLLIIEVQRGMVLREDDIERFADDYGRVSG
jgi:mannose-6-phosphate isomerase-like protein (cupin superfamily)